MIMEKRGQAFAHISDDPTVGVRLPDHDIPLAIIQGLARPLACTSANLTGSPEIRDADEIYWPQVSILPNADEVLPRESADSHYYPARNTGAAEARRTGPAVRARRAGEPRSPLDLAAGVETPSSGRLPLEQYLSTTIAEHEALSSGRKTIDWSRFTFWAITAPLK